ncbi:hypothetical protein QFZ48_003783 [Chitinophaga sp. W2I13]|uniref:hypothetical protein n=1 Tax=Chitinophaga sp. W2I13 TaxID=3373923 RepID=UPI003D22E40D
MAKQNGIIPLQGTIGNITFYKTKAGFLAREKGGVSASRIATDPAYAHTRENSAEFGRAGKAGKILRSAFRTLLTNIKDTYSNSRLFREMVKVIKADVTNARGQRNVIDGEAELLKGFEFNNNARLGATLFAPYTATIDRATGTLTVNIPAFSPINMLATPGGATHFKILAGGAEVDFEAETVVNGDASGTELPIDGSATTEMNLVTNVTSNSTRPLFLSLGVAFFQQGNGTLYALKNGINTLSLVNVSGMPQPHQLHNHQTGIKLIPVFFNN